jgi:guanylate kinase
MSKGGKLIVFSAPSGSENNDSQTSIKPRRFEFRILHFSSFANQEVKKQMERLLLISTEEFKQHIKNDDFLEWEEVYRDNFYGTLKAK